jgi:hypothetical protein
MPRSAFLEALRPTPSSPSSAAVCSRAAFLTFFIVAICVIHTLPPRCEHNTTVLTSQARVLLYYLPPMVRRRRDLTVEAIFVDHTLFYTTL